MRKQNTHWYCHPIPLLELNSLNTHWTRTNSHSVFTVKFFHNYCLIRHIKQNILHKFRGLTRDWTKITCIVVRNYTIEMSVCEWGCKSIPIQTRKNLSNFSNLSNCINISSLLYCHHSRWLNKNSYWFLSDNQKPDSSGISQSEGFTQHKILLQNQWCKFIIKFKREASWCWLNTRQVPPNTYWSFL